MPLLQAPHFVRVGTLGQVGRFLPVDPICLQRRCRVICRTARGLEVGEVVGHACQELNRDQIDGALLREVTAADELILQRLSKNRDQAFESCTGLLREVNCPAILMDVEQLFDGSTLYFYFLGHPPSETESLIQPLAEMYESKIRLAEFALAAELGCGPACGTTDAAGCGQSCTGCIVAEACRRPPGTLY
jgi:cell fate regulator YaaT (PSP1 superfamily)